jgi:glycosyltransferase involved in cell wall biosynthesis
MKILLLNQFFWPESAATSQLLTDLAVHLAEQGHEVSVICTEAGGYSISSDDQPPSVRIYRTKNLPFYRGALGRVLSYASFYISAAIRGLSLQRQDLVLTLTTPPLLSLLGTAIKTLRGSTHFIWEMDVYPDVAVDLEHFKAGGVIDRVCGMLADFSRHRADGIIALGDCMKNRLVQRGIDGDRIHVAENWADGRSIMPVGRSPESEELTVLYSGNLGLAHDVDTISGAMLNLKDDPRFRFVFVGGGGNSGRLVEFCSRNNLRHVSFHPYVQRSHLGNSLSIGDIGLVTQRESCCGSVVPSKVYGLLAAGRPILFIGPEAATPARIIRKFGCGWAVRCGDIDSLTDLLRRLADDPREVFVAGQLARETFLNHYDRPLGVARIADIMDVTRLSSNRNHFPGSLAVKEDILNPSYVSGSVPQTPERNL